MFPELPTARCAVVIHEAERALCCAVGASSKYQTSHMTTNLELLDPAKIIYSTGFFIISNYEALLIAAKHAVDNDKIFGVNLSAVYVVECFKDKQTEVLSHADYVFGNEDETSAWGRVHGVEGGAENLIEVTKALARLPKKGKQVRTVVTTQGSSPVLVATHNFETNETQTFEFPV